MSVLNDIVNKVEGWDDFYDVLLSKIPPNVVDSFKKSMGDQLIFVRHIDGLQVNISIEDTGKLKVIHLSITAVESMRPQDMTEIEHNSYLLEEAPEIVKSFFGKRTFMRAPDNAINPRMKNFFSILEN